MVYIPYRNYKYDKEPHRVQTGPVHEAFLVVSSGIQDVGADVGVVVEGTPNLSGYYSTDWRTVPVAMSGYWNNYEHTAYEPSGLLSQYDGYRPITTSTIAGVKAQSLSSPDFGLRDAGKYTYFGGNAPADQNYNPYNTPEGNSAAQGKTGGGVTHGRYEGGLLTNRLGSQGTSNRSEWQYHPPVYCKTYTETVRADDPGLMSTALRYIYRGRSTRYVSNYGAIYYQNPESVRNLIRKLG